MRRLALLVVCSLLFLAVPAHAIAYGFVDQTNQFSNVGAFVVQSPSGQNFILCSGTLIASNVFLTASHCTAYFTQVLEPSTTLRRIRCTCRRNKGHPQCGLS